MLICLYIKVIVIVQPDEIQLLAYQLHILFFKLRQPDSLGSVKFNHVLRISAKHNGFSKPAVQVSVRPDSSRPVLFAVCQRKPSHKIQGDSDFPLISPLAEIFHCQAMPHIEVIGNLYSGGKVAQPRRLPPLIIAQKSRAVGFIQGNPFLYPAMECIHDNSGVLQEIPRHIGIGPAPHVLQGLGKIPVI